MHPSDLQQNVGKGGVEELGGGVVCRSWGPNSCFPIVPTFLPSPQSQMASYKIDSAVKFHKRQDHLGYLAGEHSSNKNYRTQRKVCYRLLGPEPQTATEGRQVCIFYLTGKVTCRP